MGKTSALKNSTFPPCRRRISKGKPVGSVGIIGAASNGISALGSIVQNGSSGVDAVTLIDPLLPGCGPVFNPGSPLMVTNTSVALNSIAADNPNDFLDYLLVSGYPVKLEDYVPRDLVGEYVRFRYRQYVDHAVSRSIRVTHHAARADSVLKCAGGRYRVSLSDGLCKEFDYVLICTGFSGYKVADGFAQHAAHPRLVGSPFPVPALDRRLSRRNSHVLVLGAGLSAVDAAVAICGAGHHVTMASRTGVLPAVRARYISDPSPMPSLANIADLDPDDPLFGQKLTRAIVKAVRVLSPVPLRRQLSAATNSTRRLQEEVALLTGGWCSWQDVVFRFADEVIAWTLGIPLATQNTLMSVHGRIAFRYVASMALDNAKLLLHHIDAGRLRLGSYDPARITAHASSFDVEICGHGQQKFDYIVSAVGVHPPILHIDHQGVFLKDPPTSATVLDYLEKDLRVRLHPTAIPENIWLIGQSTHIQTFWAHTLALAAVQAYEVARQIAENPSTHEAQPEKSINDSVMPATWNSYREYRRD